MELLNKLIKLKQEYKKYKGKDNSSLLKEIKSKEINYKILSKFILLN